MPPANAASGPSLVGWAVAKLALDFPASFPDLVTTKARGLELRELLTDHPWVTPAVFERAVYLIRWKHQGPFLPAPAGLLDYCDAAARDLEQQRRAQQRALPIPEPPGERERLERDARIAAEIGAARAKLPPAMRKTSPKRKETMR